MPALAAVSAVRAPAARPAFMALSLGGRASFTDLPTEPIPDRLKLVPLLGSSASLMLSPRRSTPLFLLNIFISSPPLPLRRRLGNRVDEFRLGHGLSLDTDAVCELDQLGLLEGLQAPVRGIPLELPHRLSAGCRGLLAYLLGRLDPCLGLTCLVLGFLGQLLRLAVRLFGGFARHSCGLVRQLLGLGQLLRSVLYELRGARLCFLGLLLSFLGLALNLFLDFLPLLLGVFLGGLTFARYGLLGRLLGLRHALLDLPSRLALHLFHAGATLLADLPSVFGAVPGRERGLHGSVLGLASTLAGLPCALHPDVDRGSCSGSGVDSDNAGIATTVRRGFFSAPAGLLFVSRVEGPGGKPRSVGWHLLEARPNAL